MRAGEVNAAAAARRTGALLDATAATALLALVAIVCVDVGGRYLFGQPLRAGYELVQLAMGVMVFGALPRVSLRNEHVALSWLDGVLRGRARRVQQVGVHAVSALVMAALAWRLAVHARKLAVYGDASAILQWPTAPLAGWMALMAGGSSLLLARLALRTWRERAPGADADAGTP